MTIKHLVIGGGGPIGLIMYGALKKLHEKKVWDFKNIETIHATSIGGFIALIIILEYDWEWMDDYIIKRPWNKLFDLENKNLIYSFVNQMGILDHDIIKNSVKPLLLASDLNENITLKELYDYKNIELHLYSTNINTSDFFEKIDISYKTYPDLQLIQALIMSACIPILIKPIYFDNKFYIDGGFVNNFPLNDCLNMNNCNDSEILAFKSTTIAFINEHYTENNLNVFKYMLRLIAIFINKLIFINTNMQQNISNTIICDVPQNIYNINLWIDILNNIEKRKYLIDIGVNTGEHFYDNIYQSEN